MAMLGSIVMPDLPCWTQSCHVGFNRHVGSVMMDSIVASDLSCWIQACHVGFNRHVGSAMLDSIVMSDLSCRICHVGFNRHVGSAKLHSIVMSDLSCWIQSWDHESLRITLCDFGETFAKINSKWENTNIRFYYLTIHF
ncbi:hypothetical protein TNCV_946451 [Trichonephila clavipes]|nr:hypothetical protein TNCV_946451 [Trichonephila clavipes]